jgi:hypothetical protein
LRILFAILFKAGEIPIKTKIDRNRTTRTSKGRPGKGTTTSFADGLQSTISVVVLKR